MAKVGEYIKVVVPGVVKSINDDGFYYVNLTTAGTEETHDAVYALVHEDYVIEDEPRQEITVEPYDFSQIDLEQLYKWLEENNNG